MFLHLIVDPEENAPALVYDLIANDTVAALQAELQDAATRHAPPVELLPFARRVLELSSHAGSLPPAELQSSLMRLAIDAITQAEGAAPPLLPHLLLLPPAAIAPPQTTPTTPTQTHRYSLLPPRNNRHSRRATADR